MTNVEASALKGGNKYLKEIPIREHTAGFLFSPYRAQFDEQTKTLQFTDNTIQDIVRDELLSRAVIWLLGYDAREVIENQFKDKQLASAPIRAQAEGSHWETAWCVIHFLDARPILADKYPAIVKEIDRRLCSANSEVNPLKWLLTQAINQDEEQVYWYGKEYDTVVVTLALLRAKAEQHLELPNELKTSLDQKLPKALRWLYAHLEYALADIHAHDEDVTIFDPLIYADQHFASLLSEMWVDSYATKRKELYAMLDKWLSHFEAYLTPLKEDVVTHSIFGIDAASCLCRLVLIWQSADQHNQEYFRPFVERAKILLLHYIEFLEEWLARNQWGGTLNRVWQLSTYIEACAITERSNQKEPVTTDINIASAQDQVVLKVLSLVRNEFFSNGSIYHSVYPTTYFLRSLISVWNWAGAQKTIARLYHDLLDKFVVRMSVERKEIFELSRVVVEHERDLANEQEQHKRDLINEHERYRKLLLHERKKRYGLLAFVFVSLSAAIIYISYLLSPLSVIPNGGLVMTALAILLTLIEVLFLRES